MRAGRDLKGPDIAPTKVHPVITEIRATAAGFCLHQGAIFGGLMPPVVTYIATTYQIGFAIPMLIGTCVGAASFVIALLLGPETKGKILVPDLVVA